MRGLVLVFLSSAVAFTAGCNSSSPAAGPAARAPAATSITAAPRGNGGGWTTPRSGRGFTQAPAAARGAVAVERPPLQPAPPAWSQPPLEPAPVAGDGSSAGSGIG